MVGIKEIENQLQQTVTRMLGYDPKLYQDRVRLSWPTDGQPNWKIGEDICFLRIVPQDDLYNRQRDVSYRDNVTNLIRKDQYTRVLSVFFIFYGPNSFDRAEDIRYKVLLPEWKYELARIKLFALTEIPAPVRIPELFQGRWWERSDLSVQFNQLISRESEVPAIEGAGIVIKQECGKETVINETVPN